MSLPKLHLLNLDNDEALANGRPNYTAPLAARTLQANLTLLPLWWAQDGDYILAPGRSADEIAHAAEQAGVSVAPYQPGDECVPSPWGWSHNALWMFKRVGVPSHCLPDAEFVDNVRRLSHRGLAVDINRDLRERYGVETPNNPRLVHTAAELQQLLETHGQERLLLKRPWSGSGRGVFPIDTLTRANALRLGKGIIKAQGSVEVETMVGKRTDLSMLFSVDGSEVHFEGMGRFVTEPDGRYLGNQLLEHPNEVVQRLMPLRQMLTTLLTERLKGYRGDVGVDMLECIDSRLCPVIEVNLRTTMGFVAMHVRRRLTSLGRSVATGATLRIVTLADLRPGDHILARGHEWAMVVR